MPKGIYIRTEKNSIPWTAERKKDFSEKWSGENSPFWKGGISKDKAYQAERKRKWFKDNPERAKFLWERSHAKNRERYLLLKRLWQKNNYQKTVDYNKEYRRTHPEAVKKWRRTDWQNNKERINFRSRLREDRERNAIGKHTFEEWITLKSKYHNKCVNCKKQEPAIKLTRDHIIPLTMNGSNNIDNIQPLCGSCNSSKNNKYMNYLYA